LRQITNEKSASVTVTAFTTQPVRGRFFVHRIAKPLLTTEVALRRLDAQVAEQKLDLLKLPAGFVA